jgi:hypothetical protein
VVVEYTRRKASVSLTAIQSQPWPTVQSGCPDFPHLLLHLTHFVASIFWIGNLFWSVAEHTKHGLRTSSDTSRVSHRCVYMQFHPKVLPCPTIAFEIPTDCKTRFSNHPSKVSLTWEAPNRLDEVLVRRVVACKDGA